MDTIQHSVDTDDGTADAAEIADLIKLLTITPHDERACLELLELATEAAQESWYLACENITDDALGKDLKNLVGQVRALGKMNAPEMSRVLEIGELFSRFKSSNKRQFNQDGRIKPA